MVKRIQRSLEPQLIYIKDNTEDTVELVFNFDKIISSAENREELFDGIEILYKEDNNLGIEKEEIYNDKNIIYYKKFWISF